MTGPAAHADGRARGPSARPQPVPGTLPIQRSSDTARRVAQDCAEPATPPAGVLLLDTDSAALAALRDELTAVGIGPVTATTDPDDAAHSAGGGLAIVSMRFGSRAAAVIRTLRQQGWRRVLAFSPTADATSAVDAIHAGATGVVVARRVSPTTQQLPAGVYDLSAREIEVIRMVADGRANKWIGDQLDLSALTVKSHLARIGRKLGTGDRAHIVALALRAGVIT